MEKVRSSYAVRLMVSYGKSNVSNFASGIAFQLFLSSFPLMLGMLSFLGIFLHNATDELTVRTAILHFFPVSTSSSIAHALDLVRDHSGLLGIVGIFGFIWGGSSIFSSFEWPFDALYHVKQRTFLRQRRMALMMTAIFIIALPGTIFITADAHVTSDIPFANVVIGFLLWTGSMAVLYTVVPNCKLGLHEVWKGSVFAAILLEVLTLIWPVYLHFVHGFDSYGVVFALFFVLATWFYFLAQIILMGVVVNYGDSPDVVVQPKVSHEATPGNKKRKTQ